MQTDPLKCFKCNKASPYTHIIPSCLKSYTEISLSSNTYHWFRFEDKLVCKPCITSTTLQCETCKKDTLLSNLHNLPHEETFYIHNRQHYKNINVCFECANNMLVRIITNNCNSWNIGSANYLHTRLIRDKLITTENEKKILQQQITKQQQIDTETITRLTFKVTKLKEQLSKLQSIKSYYTDETLQQLTILKKLYPTIDYIEIGKQKMSDMVEEGIKDAKEKHTKIEAAYNSLFALGSLLSAEMIEVMEKLKQELDRYNEVMK